MVGLKENAVSPQGEFCHGKPYLFFRDPDGYEVEVWYEPPTPGGSAAQGLTDDSKSFDGGSSLGLCSSEATAGNPLASSIDVPLHEAGLFLLIRRLPRVVSPLRSHLS